MYSAFTVHIQRDDYRLCDAIKLYLSTVSMVRILLLHLLKECLVKYVTYLNNFLSHFFDVNLKEMAETTG